MSGLPSLGPRGEGWVLAQGVLLALIALAGLTGPAWGGELRAVTSVLGVGLLLGGLAVVVRGGLDLGTALTPLPHPREGAALVDHGVYRFVRHPIYGGVVLCALGWSLLWAAPIGLAISIVLFGFFALKARREEAWLEAVIPGYREYAARTRRLIPFVY